MPTDEFQNPVKLKIYHERLNKFIEAFYLSSEENKSLYLGYVVHLIADEISNTLLRTPFNRLMFKYEIGPNEIALFDAVLSDIDYADKFVLNKYPYSRNIVNILDSIWDYDIKGLVGKEEINSNKRYVIEKFQKKERPKRALQYYSYDDAVEFIDYSVNEIVNRLSGKSDMIKII